MPHRRHFSHHDLSFDPAELMDSLHDVIEAAIDAGMDSLYTLGDSKTWKPDDLRNEARAFAGRFSAHPSWRSARSRMTGGSSASRAWSDTD